jgi:hypothetical protein
LGAGGARPKASVKQMSQSRYPGERPLTGEDRPADRAGGKAQGRSATPRGRGGTPDQIGEANRARLGGNVKTTPRGSSL